MLKQKIALFLMAALTFNLEKNILTTILKHQME